MKQFRLLGMAVVALVMAIGFVACSSNDDDDNNKTLVEKKLMSISKDDGEEDESSITNFVYGTDGKLTKATVTLDRGTHDVNFSWNGNSITLTSSRGEEPCTITLKDGKISSANTEYTGNYILKTGKTEFNWENGNITKTIEKEADGNYYYTCTYYTDKVNKHPIFDFEGLRLTNTISSDDGDLLLMAHPELLGTSNKNLLKSVTETDEEHSYTNTTNYTYEFDADGYPTKITKTEDDSGDDPYTIVYTLTWK